MEAGVPNVVSNAGMASVTPTVYRWPYDYSIPGGPRTFCRKTPSSFSPGGLIKMEFLRAIENSGLGSWVRESTSIWAYPTIIFFHGVGMGLLVGMNTVF